MKFKRAKRLWGAGVILLAALGCRPICKDETVKIEANMFIKIPGGRFRMGIEKELADELLKDDGWLSESLIPGMPAHEVEVAPFQISKTPVTNAEYAEFVNAGGYNKTPLWKAIFEERGYNFELTDFEKWFARWKENRKITDSTGKLLGPAAWKNGKPLPGEELHPVSGVSYYEAFAYCAFNGWRLPTDAEWEFAARGTDGRIYPWGNEFDPCRCATAEHNGPDTVPVNTMPGGQSPFGVMHMVGNVAEWVSGYFRPYPGSVTGWQWLESDCITRSTFGGDAKILIASFRINREATTRSQGYGFRCAKDADAP